jgi:hypothetical protein
MSDPLTVDWIEKIKADQDTEARLIQEHSQYCILAEALAKAEGPDCFERVLKEIQFQAIASAKIGAAVTVSEVSRPADKEANNHVFRINVRSKLGYASTTYLDLSYVKGSFRIRCFPRDAASFDIDLRPDRQGRLVMIGPTGELETEAKTASLILAPLVRSVLGR